MLKIKVREAIETPALIDLQMDEKNNTLLAKMASHSDAEALLSILSNAFDGKLSEYMDAVVSYFVVYNNVAVFMDNDKALNAVNDFILESSMQ